jgi:hypothetical protein
MLRRCALTKQPTLPSPDDEDQPPPENEPPKKKKKKDKKKKRHTDQSLPDADLEEAPPPRHNRTLPAAPDEEEAPPVRTHRPPPDVEETAPNPRPSPESEGEGERSHEMRTISPHASDEGATPSQSEGDDEGETPRHGGVHSAREYTSDDDLQERSATTHVGTYGIVAEIAPGWALVQSTRGAFPDSRFGFGLKFTWEFGQRLSKVEDDWIRSGVALQFSWTYTSLGGVGTQEVSVNSAFHYFSLAGIVGWPIGEILLYLEFGPSLAYEPVSYSVDGIHTSFGAVTFGLLYGVGGRYRIEINDGREILYFRLALDLFRRGYMNDGFLSLGAGVGF